MTTVNENERLAKMTMVDLKSLAKTRGLRGYSTKRKSDLIALLLGVVPAPTVDTMTIPQLKEAIKARGGKGYSGRNKKELQVMLAGLHGN